MLTIPPASLTIKVPAAISHKFKPFWKYPSILPEATYARSSAALPNILAFKSEDDIDTTEEYSKSGAEVQYTIASGLTAYINVDDYEYTAGGASATSDSGTNTKLTLKATF